jgi:hypothetical protein
LANLSHLHSSGGYWMPGRDWYRYWKAWPWPSLLFASVGVDCATTLNPNPVLAHSIYRKMFAYNCRCGFWVFCYTQAGWTNVSKGKTGSGGGIQWPDQYW